MNNKKKKFLAPEIKVVEIEAAEIICGSDVQSQSMEPYEDGDITGWY